ncbi:MAG: hypothetical protein KC620_16760 [Myxococcales bacterium]|nr:hypothetical protein [Myxococcales bacterium]
MTAASWRSGCLLAALLLAGCAGRPPVTEGPTAERPAWVDRGALDGPGLFGVAHIEHIAARDLREATAEARARAEVAARVTAAMTTALDAAGLPEDTRDAAGRVLDDLALGRIEIIARYYTLDGNVQHALARLRADDLDGQLADLDDVDPTVRDALRAAGRAAFAGQPDPASR